jgi:hypothetical protein
MEEMAQATEELIAELTEKQSRQVETLIKANNEAIEKLTAAIKASNQGSNSSNNQGNKSGQNNSSGSTATAVDKPGWLRRKEASREKWRVKKDNATTCPHCDRKHPNRTHDQCWELPANADKRPANWTSVKST